MTKNNPIGLFDSGIGGTTIWREVHKLLPNEDTIFIGDQLNAPYGIKTQSEIIALSLKNVECLLQLNCKLIIIACNTATTNAIKEIRQQFQVPIIGIEPAIKPATSLTKTSTIGVLATKGTITSDLFSSKLKLYPNVKIIEQIGYNIVNLIESGKTNTPEMRALLKEYLDPMIAQGMDTLVLGCTHYPYLKPILTELLGDSITIIDSGKAVAKQTKNVLQDLDLLNNKTSIGKCLFYTNTDTTILQSFLDDGDIAEYKNF
ncbi:glutamate racemase [Myroides pelagicus]|uniref:Glutamate racemase n=1 Tax=Myroides pelagicus TaxID=270914 RepID=A0A7K1GIK7_9FLAO|nr:glutamate racemase [Myroides pelagicus]MEC4112866.1 glutamate racemase [Myroides pelagicus]MTH28676.1 glutamate racemase [Myroides pelagicus]